MSVRRSCLALFAIVLMASAVKADDCGCDTAAAPCDAQPVYVEKTVCVPQWVTEKRVVTCTQYVPEQRTKTVTCYKLVPEVKEVTRQCTVMVPEVRTRTVNYTVCKPVYETKTCEYQVRVPVYRDVEQTYTCRVPRYKTVEKTYTAMVPTREKREGVRKVCKVVQETEMRSCTVDEGHWDTQMVEVPCTPAPARTGLLGRCRLFRRTACSADSCCGCASGCDCDGCGAGDCGCTPTTTVCQKVWVPNLVTKEVPVAVCKTVVEEVPCEYWVTVCKPETRTCHVQVCEWETVTKTRTVRVCDYQTETRTKTYQTCSMVPQQMSKEVQYTVCVPKTVTKTQHVTVCQRVPYEKEVTYTVCVPQTVEKEVNVRVCKMVQKTMKVPVCGGCAAGCGCN